MEELMAMLLGNSPLKWTPGDTPLPAAAAHEPPCVFSPATMAALASPLRPLGQQQQPASGSLSPLALLRQPQPLPQPPSAEVAALLEDGGLLGADLAADLRPLTTAAEYETALQPLAPYSLDRRTLHEKNSTNVQDLLMAKTVTLRKDAMVLSYTFPDGAKVGLRLVVGGGVWGGGGAPVLDVRRLCGSANN
jgi:hypothetical protein